MKVEQNLLYLYLDIYSMDRRVRYYFNIYDKLFIKVKLYRSLIGKSKKTKKELEFIFNIKKAKPNKATNIVQINLSSYNKIISNFHMLIIEEISSSKNYIDLPESEVVSKLKEEKGFKIYLQNEKDLRKFLTKSNNGANFSRNIKISKIYKEISSVKVDK